MNLQNHSHHGGGRLSLLLAAGFLLVLIGGTPLVSAQAGGPSQTNEQDLTMSDLLKLPGKVLGEGSNVRAAGKYKVASYRVEELTLPRPQEVLIGGQKVQATRAFRVTVTGGPFPVRALPPVVWIDDTAVGYGVEDEDLKAITAVTFDPQLLREGAKLYLSYGDKEDKTDRVEVPERLKLDGAKGGAR